MFLMVSLFLVIRKLQLWLLVENGGLKVNFWRKVVSINFVEKGFKLILGWGDFFSPEFTGWVYFCFHSLALSFWQAYWNLPTVNIKLVIMRMQKDIACSCGGKRVTTQVSCYFYLQFTSNAGNWTSKFSSINIELMKLPMIKSTFASLIFWAYDNCWG